MDKYTSTLLAQDSSPVESQKVALDLLKKTNAVYDETMGRIGTVDTSTNARIDAILAADAKFLDIGCVVRNTAGTWAIISDTDHIPKGVTSVDTLSGGGFRLYYEKTCAKVISLVACPDEVYAAMGWGTGGSVGLSYADINVCGHYLAYTAGTDMAFLFQKGTAVYGYIYYSGSAFTYSDSSGITSLSWDAGNGILTINHNVSSGVPMLTPRIETNYAQVQFSTFGTNTTLVKFIRNGIVPNDQSNLAYSNVWVLGRMQYVL
jgi:hypothetical protein